MEESLQRLKNFAVTIALISLFFWGWALLNCIYKGFDLGIISFATTFLSSIYILLQPDKEPTSNLVQTIISGTHFFVAFNYLLGVVVSISMELGIGFMIYCTVFTVLWVQVALVGKTLIQSTRTTVYDEVIQGGVIAWSPKLYSYEVVRTTFNSDHVAALVSTVVFSTTGTFSDIERVLVMQYEN